MVTTPMPWLRAVFRLRMLPINMRTAEALSMSVPDALLIAAGRAVS